MAEEIMVLGGNNGIDKIFGNLLVGKILPVCFFKETTYLGRTVTIIDRALHGEDVFNIALADGLARFAHDKPVITTNARNDRKG